MRISDWSSDVCSSDLLATGIVHQRADFGNRSFKHTMSRWIGDHECGQTLAYFGDLGFQVFNVDVAVFVGSDHDTIHAGQLRRSEERLVGQECVRKCRSRGSPYYSKKTTIQ